MNEISYHKKLDRVLDRMGGIYHPSDILDRIADGRMQSFVHGNSWLITEINVFPRARTMDWIAAIGDLDDCRVIHDMALDFADKLNIPLIRAYGRRGWLPDAQRHGWRRVTTNDVYLKEL